MAFGEGAMSLDAAIRQLVAEEVAKAEERLRAEFAAHRPSSPYMTVSEATKMPAVRIGLSMESHPFIRFMRRVRRGREEPHLR